MSYLLAKSDAIRIPLPDGCVQCCVTSPPYWGLRDYGVAGQIGLEDTPDEYVAKMVRVFAEVRRVLRDDGVLFLNLGDSYFGSNMTGGTSSNEGSTKRTGRMFSMSALSRHAVACDTSGKAPEDFPVNDCLCGSLCDACRVAYQTGRSHSDSRPAPTPLPSPCESSPAHTGLPNGHLPTLDSLPPAGHTEDATPDPEQTSCPGDGQIPASPESMPGGSSSQRLEGCRPSGLPSGCRLCGRSLADCAQASAHKTACTCGTAKHSDALSRRMSGKSSLDLAYPHFTTATLKQKDLIGIPWRVAFALQADGWHLRSDIIWAKPNPMPESVTDRPTKAHEYVFLLTKRPTYFYDAEAVREKGSDNPVTLARKTRTDNGAVGTSAIWGNGYGQSGKGDNESVRAEPGRNLRSVWTITPEPFAGAHFATFPTELAARCVKAGTSERGCCPRCGRPWERAVEREATNHISRIDRQIATGGAINGGVGKNFPDVKLTDIGFRQSCPCPAAAPVPCVVLDPFNGSGTTGVVATGLGRRYVGFDINPEYLDMARRRIERPHAPVRKVDRPMPLFAAMGGGEE